MARKAGYICAVIAIMIGATLFGCSLCIIREKLFIIGILLMIWGFWRTGFLNGRDAK